MKYLIMTNLHLITALLAVIFAACEPEDVQVENDNEENNTETDQTTHPIEEWDSFDFKDDAFIYDRTNTPNNYEWLDFDGDGHLDLIYIRKHIYIRYGHDLDTEVKLINVDKISVEGSPNTKYVTSFSISDMNNDGSLDVIYKMSGLLLNDYELFYFLYAFNDSNGSMNHSRLLKWDHENYFYPTFVEFGPSIDFDEDGNNNIVLVLNHHDKENDPNSEVSAQTWRVLEPVDDWSVYEYGLSLHEVAYHNISLTPSQSGNPQPLTLNYDLLYLDGEPVIATNSRSSSYMYLYDTPHVSDAIVIQAGSNQSTFHSFNGSLSAVYTNTAPYDWGSNSFYGSYTKLKFFHDIKNHKSQNRDSTYSGGPSYNYEVLELDQETFGIVSSDYDNDGDVELILTQKEDNHTLVVKAYALSGEPHNLSIELEKEIFSKSYGYLTPFSYRLKVLDLNADGYDDFYFEYLGLVIFNPGN